MSRTKDANSRLEQCENQTAKYGKQIENLEAVVVEMHRRFQDMVSNLNQISTKNTELAEETEQANSKIHRLTGTISKMQLQLRSRNNGLKVLLIKSLPVSVFLFETFDM